MALRAPKVDHAGFILFGARPYRFRAFVFRMETIALVS
jgi:hypothetical protein